MHLVVFDIDGTLTDTNKVDGVCYWQAVREVLGLAQEQPDWSGFRHVTDVGIAAEIRSAGLAQSLAEAVSAGDGAVSGLWGGAPSRIESVAGRRAGLPRRASSEA